MADYPITSRVKPRDVYRAPAESLIFSRCGGERCRPEAAGLKWPGLGQFRKTSLALSTLALNSLLRSLVRSLVRSCAAHRASCSDRSPLHSLSLSLSLPSARDDTTGRGKKSPRGEGREERWVRSGNTYNANIRSNNPLGESPHWPLPSASRSGAWRGF